MSYWGIWLFALTFLAVAGLVVGVCLERVTRVDRESKAIRGYKLYSATLGGLEFCYHVLWNLMPSRVLKAVYRHLIKEPYEQALEAHTERAARMLFDRMFHDSTVDKKQNDLI